MSDQIRQDMQDSALYDDLITRFVTLTLILEDIDKINIVINDKIKQLEVEKAYELEFLEETLRNITLRNRYHGRPNNIEEEIDLRRQTKKKTDNIEKLRKEVVKEWEFRYYKILKDLNYAMYDEIDKIAKTELELKGLEVLKKSINLF